MQGNRFIPEWAYFSPHVLTSAVKPALQFELSAQRDETTTNPARGGHHQPLQWTRAKRNTAEPRKRATARFMRS